MVSVILILWIVIQPTVDSAIHVFEQLESVWLFVVAVVVNCRFLFHAHAAGGFIAVRVDCTVGSAFSLLALWSPTN